VAGESSWVVSWGLTRLPLMNLRYSTVG